MDLGLTGKVAIITGSSRGLGLAAAAALAAEGAHVVMCARGESVLLTAAESVRKVATGGARVVTVVADVSTESGVQAVVEAIVDVDESVVRHLHAMHRVELLRPRSLGREDLRRAVVGRVAIGAPHALERAGVGIEARDVGRRHLDPIGQRDVDVACVGDRAQQRLRGSRIDRVDLRPQ